MAPIDNALPLIDFSGYISPKATPESKAKVIKEVSEACARYGFFQLSNHGVPLVLQKAHLQALSNFFSLPKEEKMRLSFLKDPCRRGYESSGDSLRDGDPLPDSKESFYIGREDPFEPPGFYGPNVWPDLPEEDFHGPVWEYYQTTGKLGRTIWEVLLQGLGYPVEMLDVFAKRPIVQMKNIRYPPMKDAVEGQFGVGAHTDFGGVTVLLQQAGKEGLEVFDTEAGENGEWLSVPAIEDVYVINMGDMVAKWSGGRFKSAKHRVTHKIDSERLSCATFWHGDSNATNPLNPDDPDRSTVGKLLLNRFRNQFTLPKEVDVAA